MPTIRSLVLLMACALSVIGTWPAKRAVQAQDTVQEDKARDKAAQQPAGQGADVVRIRTELVQIDVAVKDAKGAFLRDLQRGDFEILEDGRPQVITHFAVGSATRPAAFLPQAAAGRAANPADATSTAGADVAAPIAPGRHIVLAVDDYHLVAENLFAVKAALRQFIETAVAPEDRVAMMATSGVLGLYEQFTTDRAAIKRAIERLRLQDRTGTHLGGVPYISAYQAELIEENDAEALQIALEEIGQRQGRTTVRGNNSSLRSPPRGTDPDEGAVRAKARNIVMENARYTAITLASLEQTIRRLSQLPGRKVMVLLSDGFFTKNLAVMSAYDLRRITDAATRAGVVIYSVDARGLVAKPTLGSAADPQSSTVTRFPEARKRVVQGEIGAKQEGLFTLAKDTGGLPFFNNNDLGNGLRRVLEDTEAYYVLAYEPTNQARDGRFRKIMVRLAGHPEARIQTRAGYFAPTETTAEAEPKKKEKPAKKAAQEAAEAKLNQYRAALTSLVPLRDIPLTMQTHFIRLPSAEARGIITAQLDVSNLGLGAPKALEIFGVVLDESGKAVNTFSQTFELKAETNSAAPRQTKLLNYHNVVPLGAGLYHVRLAVADAEMACVGTAAAWLEVPPLKPQTLSLSSLFLAAEGQELGDIYDALGATLGNSAPGSRALEPQQRFKRGINLDFLVLAYQTQVDAQGIGRLLIQVNVLQNGKVLYAAPPGEIPLTKEFAEQGQPCIARVPLFTYEPGAYELQLEITDQVSKQSATRKLSFTIE